VPAPRHSSSRLTKKVAAFVEWERVARVATSGRSGIPHVVPVCFALQGATLYITIDAKPANGRPNHLQLTGGSTIIAAREWFAGFAGAPR